MTRCIIAERSTPRTTFRLLLESQILRSSSTERSTSAAPKKGTAWMVVPVTCPSRLWGGRNRDLMIMMMPLRDPRA